MNKGFQQINNFEATSLLVFFIFCFCDSETGRSKKGLSLSTSNGKMLIKFFTKFF